MNKTQTMVSFIIMTTCKQRPSDPTDRASPQQCSKQKCLLHLQCSGSRVWIFVTVKSLGFSSLNLRYR